MEQLSFLLNIYKHPLLTDTDMQQLAAAHKKVVYKKGDIILKQGQVAGEYAVIQNGLVRSFVYDYNGNDITTNFFGINDIVIEVASLFQRSPSQEIIQAVTDCTCWKIDFNCFQQLYHSITGFNEWGRAWMAMQLFHFKQRSVTIFTHSAMDRYMQLLNEKPQILQQAPLKQIATYLGITDSSLSRIRKTASVQ